MQEAPLVTMRELVELYKSLHLSTLADGTQFSQRCRIRKYFDPLLPLPLTSLTQIVVVKWVNDIRQHSKTQADGCISILRSMFNRAIEWGLWTGINPGIYVKRKKPSIRKRYVMESEQPALIREIEREPIMSRLFFYLVMFCASRPGEAERIKVADLKAMDHGYLWRKPNTKNGEEQWIPLPDPLPDLLRRHLSVLPPQQVYLFQNHRRTKPLGHTYWTNEWKHIRKRAGLGPEKDEHGRNIKGTAIRIHDLRRTCSTRLLNAKNHEERLDLISLSKGVLNHSNINTTRIYAIPELERIREALNANAKHVLAAGGAVYPANNNHEKGAAS